MTSNAKAEGRFSKNDFVYGARNDEYRCPAGQGLRLHHTSVEAGLRIRYYWTAKCPECPLKAKCTTGNERRVRRWEHEAVLEVVQKRLDRQPDAMLMRKRTIEHVFGTLKHWMGWTHFLTRGMDNVSTEMSLSVLAYNLKRVIGILGLPGTLKAMELVGASAPLCGRFRSNVASPAIESEELRTTRHWMNSLGSKFSKLAPSPVQSSRRYHTASLLCCRSGRHGEGR